MLVFLKFSPNILLTKYKKGQNWVIRSDVDETRVCIQSEVSQKEKSGHCVLTHIYIYIEVRKMVQVSLFAGQE